MAQILSSSPSTSTYVDIDAPDAPTISTPLWSPPVHSQNFSGLPPHDQVMHNISSVHSFPSYATPVQTLPPALGGYIPMQPLSWSQEHDSMQLCTSADVSSPSTMDQHDLPRNLPTPGREIQQVSSHVQGNLDTLMVTMKRQEKCLHELTQRLKTSSQHANQISTLTAKVESNKQQIVTILTAAKQQEAAEADQLVKAVQLMLATEFQKFESTLTSAVVDKVEKLRIDVQHDLNSIQQTLHGSLDQLTTNLQDCEETISKCHTCVTKLQNDFQVHKMKDVEPQTEAKAAQVSSTLSTGTVSTSLPNPMVKSDHLKLTFPTFGRHTDDTDPLLYLTKCQDFLALHPLTDADLLATFRTVLYGTARDWWEVSRSNITTWKEFESAFLSAFLSEDYEDELAERIRTRVQGDRESVRDFAFTYRALCKKWKSTLTETEIVKMILKNIKPYLASQLRSRVNTGGFS